LCDASVAAPTTKAAAAAAATTTTATAAATTTTIPPVAKLIIIIFLARQKPSAYNNTRLAKIITKSNIVAGVVFVLIKFTFVNEMRKKAKRKIIFNKC